MWAGVYLVFMARTTRKFMTDGNYREARQGRMYDRRKSGTPTAFLKRIGFVDTWNGIEHTVLWKRVEGGSARPCWANGDPRWGVGNVRGGMLMSTSNSGLWRDDYTQGDRVITRATKRAERQRVNAEVAEQLDNIDWSV